MPLSSGWRLEGSAVFLHEGLPARLSYQVEADERWRSRTARVNGWIGARSIEHRIARGHDGRWTLDDEPAAVGAGCLDLDLGFTPATNWIALRRLELAPGTSADAPAVWLDAPADALTLLPQRYERRSATTYWYESPSAGYAALLEVDPRGFVREYPGLWEAVASFGPADV